MEEDAGLGNGGLGRLAGNPSSCPGQALPDGALVSGEAGVSHAPNTGVLG